MSGSVEQIEYIVNQNVIPSLCQLLDQQDTQIIHVCLDALQNILRQTLQINLEKIIIVIEECGGNKNFLSSFYLFDWFY